MTKTVPHGQKRPFSHYLLISMVLLILLVASGITIIDYYQAKDTYEKNAASLETETEQNIIQSIRIIDAGFLLFDESQNERLRDGFAIFMGEYERAGRDPARMDLEGIRTRIGTNADVYIINESGVIEFSTYTPDQGLDFKNVPYFYDYLTKIRMSEGYFSDRVVHELNASGNMRKFAYMPTPDHKYVLEIGLTGQLFNTRHSIGQYQDNIDQIVYLNPQVRDVVIFDITKKPVNATGYVPDAKTTAILDKVIVSRAGMTVVDTADRTKTNYLFVDLQNDQYGSDVSQIVRITYDTSIIEEQLNELLLAHLVAAMIAVILGIIVAILVSRLLAEPVYQIVSDVDRIARGDLNHTISPPSIGKEFVELQESVNTMVGTLTETIAREKEREDQIRRFSGELEGRIVERTAELQRTQEAFRQANKKLNLLSSITRHDILNQLTLIMGYIRLARDKTKDDDVKRYLGTAQKSAEVIDRHMIFTQQYQDVGVHAPAWQNVQQIFDKVSKDFRKENISILVDTADLELFADPLLEKVFYTLAENTVRHGEHATRIQISFTRSNDGRLTLVYEDNGEGINANEKTRIFEWGYGKHTGFGLFLSREILAITGLDIRETGDAGTGARFEITVPKNAYRFVGESSEKR